MPTQGALLSGEFPDIVGAFIFAVNAGANAIAYILDLGIRKIDFRSNASYIETFDI